MPHIGMPEWIVIFLVVLILFGPKALPKIGQSIGSGIRELKDALSGVSKEIEKEETPPRLEGSMPRSAGTTSGDASAQAHAESETKQS